MNRSNQGKLPFPLLILSLYLEFLRPFLQSQTLYNRLGMVVHGVIPVLRRPRQEDYKFKASLGYTVRPCLTSTSTMNPPNYIIGYINYGHHTVLQNTRTCSFYLIVLQPIIQPPFAYPLALPSL
jgi:hypothetical protein